MYISYAMYVIWFSDLAEYNAAVVTAGGNGYGHCPLAAAVEFGVTWPLVGGGPISGTKGIYGSLPYGIPASPGPGFEISHPNHAGTFLRSDLDNVIVPGQTMNPPSGLTAPGEDMNLIWWGNIVYAPNEVVGVPPTTPIPQRRWITGFENAGSYSDAFISYNIGGGRVGSRTLEGNGYVIRGNSTPGSGEMNTNRFRPGLTPRTSWERFYIRINALGTNLLSFWWAKGNIFDEGGSLKINETTGRIEVWNAWNATLGTKLGESSVLTLGKWYLVDIILEFAPDIFHLGQQRLYLNHNLEVTGSINDPFGMNRVTHHVSTVMGQRSPVEASWDIDIDDWICADVPNNGGVESLDSIDWVMGSHVRLYLPESATFTNWGPPGVVQQLWGGAAPFVNDTPNCTTTTALATVEATDTGVTFDDQIFPGIVLGPVAILATNNNWAGGAGTGRIGYSLSGGVYTYVNTDDDTDFKWHYILYGQSAQPLPIDITPFKMIRENYNGVTQRFLLAFNAMVEYIGIWGKEDDSIFPIDLSNTNSYKHNARYGNTIYGLLPNGGVPDAPVFTISGTYVGNGTGQVINLPSPAHFIFIRPVTVGGGSYGALFFSANMSGHRGGQGNIWANIVPRCWTDSNGDSHFAVAGNGAETNGNGITYQYVVFCDPGMRFNYCDAYNIKGSLANKTFSLFDPNFLAQAGFVQREFYAGVDSTVYTKYKGTGNAGNTGVGYSGTNYNNWGSFAAGALTLLSDNIYTWNQQNNYSLWKSIDYEGYCAVQITNYTGNGLAARTINFPVTTGRWPLLAIVLPHGSNGYVRDPSHVGNDSSRLDFASNSTTAITGGGPDLINIGLTLNTNGVIYEVFVILGDDDGWNNGTYWLPSTISSGPWILPSYAPPNQPIITMEGGMDFNGNIPILAVVNLSGIYTLVPNKRNDTLYTGIAATTVDVKVPNPMYKTGYIGG